MNPFNTAWLFLKEETRQTSLSDFVIPQIPSVNQPAEPYTGYNEFGDRIRPDGSFIPADEMTDEEHMQMVKDHLRLVAQQAPNVEYREKEEAAKNRAIGNVPNIPVVEPPRPKPRHPVKVKKKPVEQAPAVEPEKKEFLSEWQKQKLKEQDELTDEERKKRIKSLNERYVEDVERQRARDSGDSTHLEGLGTVWMSEDPCDACGKEFMDYSAGAIKTCQKCLKERNP